MDSSILFILKDLLISSLFFDFTKNTHLLDSLGNTVLCGTFIQTYKSKKFKPIEILQQATLIMAETRERNYLHKNPRYFTNNYYLWH